MNDSIYILQGTNATQFETIIHRFDPSLGSLDCDDRSLDR